MVAALQMSGDDTTVWLDGYYSQKLWLNHVSKSGHGQGSELIASNVQTAGPVTPNHKDEKTDSDISHGSGRGEWDGYFFAENPHSNQDLRELIPPALAALQKANQSSDGWKTPTTTGPRLAQRAETNFVRKYFYFKLPGYHRCPVFSFAGSHWH
ncbi:uncharacterized protein TRUGW13939_05211 [Talaromyces rugulosus]|uniref:Uncharacterized protein n=1 Tax=Talaromyces rugulosus TaxID=121627 RepID=A0A7H8QVN4_TALRU|nr:uncharacterized protein TRUGW13939_05211 [Talaromyces rugulosus]QKX58090.1 hypothetical protein TRUGW13939_05211 [Talaromyces rugulosus]